MIVSCEWYIFVDIFIQVLSTQWDWMTHRCIDKSCQHWSTYWFVVWSPPSFCRLNAFRNWACGTVANFPAAFVIFASSLTHWGRVTHICVSELTIIGSDNGLSPGRRQAIIWNNAGLLLIEPLETNFSEISIGIQTFSLKKMHLNMSSAKWPPFCLGLNVLSPHNACSLTQF